MICRSDEFESNCNGFGLSHLRCLNEKGCLIGSGSGLPKTLAKFFRGTFDVGIRENTDASR